MFVHHGMLGSHGGQKMVLDLLKVELYTNGCEEHAGKQTWVFCYPLSHLSSSLLVF